MSVNQKLFLTAVGLSGAFAGLWFHVGFSTLPFLISFMITIVLVWDFHKNPAVTEKLFKGNTVKKPGAFLVTGLSLWVIFQLLIPMRHVVIPGNPSWTEEGHRFAWHMKLRSKSCNEQFYIKHRETGERIAVQGMPFLENWQRRKVSGRPQMVIQYASFLSEINHGQPVYADIECSLNGAPYRQLIDPDVDLTLVKFRDWKRNDWILR